MSITVNFGGLATVLPDGWADVTEDLPEGSPPTLARQDGVGALQLSVAKYKSGTVPNVSVADLEEMLMRFAESKGLGAPVRRQKGRGAHPYVAGDFDLDGETIRVWYLSNGRDVALVTYVAQEAGTSQVQQELQETAHIVEAMAFA